MSLTLILSRFVGVPMALIPRVLPSPSDASRVPPLGHRVVISWAGMRGVVSLAAALALPLDFPYRDPLVFLACCAILATLVLQGTTLEWAIRRFGVAEKPVAGMAPAAGCCWTSTARAP